MRTFISLWLGLLKLIGGWSGALVFVEAKTIGCNIDCTGHEDNRLCFS